jgi:hypothetical protein
MAARIVKFALVGSAVCLGVSLGLGVRVSQSAKQVKEVAYVEAVSGHVVAFTQGKPMLLDVLDTIGVGTQLDLKANSELRICHYRIHKLLTLKGPLRASISASGVTAKNGTDIKDQNEACAEPVVSTFQGGVAARSVTITSMNVPLRPSIKIVNRGKQAISRVVLRDGVDDTLLMNLNSKAAQPILTDGQSYVLVIERSSGSKLRMQLRASAAIESGPLIFVVR